MGGGRGVERQSKGKIKMNGSVNLYNHYEKEH